jgi:hypothetical protein
VGWVKGKKQDELLGAAARWEMDKQDVFWRSDGLRAWACFFYDDAWVDRQAVLNVNMPLVLFMGLGSRVFSLPVYHF